MSGARGMKFSLALAALAVIVLTEGRAFAQANAAAPSEALQTLDLMKWGTPTNNLPNPYRTVEGWYHFPEGRTMGATAGVGIDSKGNIWVAERCGATYPNNCKGSHLPPIVEFDPSGKMLTAFGADMFIMPHGLYIDKDDGVWVTDQGGTPADGKGQQVFKFSPTGKVLLALGKAGTPGDGNDEFNNPSSVIVAPNGDIFVGDGHGGKSNARVIKFDKHGKFLMMWGHLGSGPGEFDIPHCFAFDSKGRLFVCDRGNNRIQIFDQDGHFIDQWTQFSRPSGISIDTRTDTMYVADSESGGVSPEHGAWRRGIRVGSAKDGTVKYLIPDPNDDPQFHGTSAAEGVAVDKNGVVYGAEVGPKDVKRYVLAQK